MAIVDVDRKKICMLVYSFYESDNRVMRYAETLARRGDHVDVFALRKAGQPYHDLIRGVNVYRIQGRIKDEKKLLTYIFRLGRFMIKAGLFLTAYHLKNHYSVIHVHNIPNFIVFSAIFLKLFDAKVVLDIHDMVPELFASLFHKTKDDLLFKALQFTEKLSCSFSDHIIISNDIWFKVIAARSAKADKCSVILNYPDENVFFKRPRIRQDNKFIMIYPGSLNERQGVDISIKALALIKDKIPMVEFHIYGEGAARSDLDRLAFNLGVQDRVLFKGSLPIYEVADKMANADLGIEPKRNDMFAGDAMSTKILEFMSLGVPVIVSDTRVHRYYFRDSNVLFFKSDDEQDLARCMLSLIENADLRRKMILNSEEFVEDYVWDKKKEEYLRIIDDLHDLAKYKTSSKRI